MCSKNLSPSLPEYLSSSPVFSGVRIARSIALCVMVYRSLCFVLFLLTFVLSVLFWFTTSDYPFVIFKLFLTCIFISDG